MCYDTLERDRVFSMLRNYATGETIKLNVVESETYTCTFLAV